MRLTLFLVIFALGLVTLLLVQRWHEWNRFHALPLNPDGELQLWVAPGTSYSGLVRELERLGLAQPDWQWRLFGRLHAPGVQAGEYRIPAASSVAALMQQLERGETRDHRLTIIEGWTLNRLRAELANDPRLVNRGHDLSEAELMEGLGCTGCFGEGRFLPETYFFTRGSSDLDILRRAYRAMEEALAAAWSGRGQDLPLASPEELLVLASIIERETGQAAERSEVAGVFVRRLQRGMRLQTDPTVMYGLGDDFDRRLRRVHLRTDHPWNTYTRHGLPPTPIALPGRDSLQAAARPAEGTALYFVSRGDGTHQFSDTLTEHNAAVNRYIRGRR